MSRPESARDGLAVALDVPTLERAASVIRALAGEPGWLKVGGELFTAAGPPALKAAAGSAKVFLDTKLHDIPNTVARTVAVAVRHGVSMLTLHAGGGSAMLQAARESAAEAAAACGSPRPALIGVTVLTSLSPPELKEVGVAAERLEDQVARLVDLAVATGLDGIVASARAGLARRRSGPVGHGRRGDRRRLRSARRGPPRAVGGGSRCRSAEADWRDRAGPCPKSALTAAARSETATNAWVGSTAFARL
jgi:orotidine-5'-phosphate decarboxylase